MCVCVYRIWLHAVCCVVKTRMNGFDGWQKPLFCIVDEERYLMGILMGTGCYVCCCNLQLFEKLFSFPDFFVCLIFVSTTICHHIYLFDVLETLIIYILETVCKDIKNV